MLGKIISAAIGSKIAKARPGGLEGTGGALLGVAASSALRKASLPTLLALGVGSYLVKKRMDRSKRRTA